MLWNFQTFSCWLKLPNMAEWQFVFQMWDGVLPNPWDYESLRVPREMQVEHLFFFTAHFIKQFGGFWKFCNGVVTKGDVFLERDIPGIIRRVHAKAAFQWRGQVNSDCYTFGRWAVQCINIVQTVFVFPLEFTTRQPFDIVLSMVGFQSKKNMCFPKFIFDRQRGSTPWLCSSGRCLWMSWTNMQKPIGLPNNGPQHCHEIMGFMRLWTLSKIVGFSAFSGTKPRFWRILRYGLQVFGSNIVFPGPARLFRLVLPALASRRRTPGLRRDICLNFSHFPETAR